MSSRYTVNKECLCLQWGAFPEPGWAEERTSLISSCSLPVSFWLKEPLSLGISPCFCRVRCSELAPQQLPLVFVVSQKAPGDTSEEGKGHWFQFAAGHGCGQHTLGKAGCDSLWKQKEEFGKDEALQTSSFNFCREEMGKKPCSCSIPAFYRIFKPGTAAASLLIALGNRSLGTCQSCGATPLYPQLKALEGSLWDRINKTTSN